MVNKNKKKILSRRQATIIIAIAVALVCFVSYVAYAQQSTTWPFQDHPKTSSSSDNSKNNNSQPSIKEEEQTGEDIKKEVIKQDQKSMTSDSTVSITSYAQQDDIIIIRTLISKVTNKGTCTLSLVRGELIIKETSGVQPLSSSSTCKGFNINNSLLSAGEWSINITYSDEFSKSSTDTAIINIE